MLAFIDVILSVELVVLAQLDTAKSHYLRQNHPQLGENGSGAM